MFSFSLFHFQKLDSTIIDNIILFVYFIKQVRVLICRHSFHDLILLNGHLFDNSMPEDTV